MIAQRQVSVSEEWKPGQGFGNFKPSSTRDAQRELIEAAANGDLTRIAMVLDNKTIDVNAGSEHDNQPALHVAARRGHNEAVSMLIEHGADVNAQGDFKNTALHLACFNGQHDVVDMLLRAGADTELQNNAGWTPIFWPCTKSNTDILVKLLLAGADLNATSPEGWTPLHKACEYGLVHIVEALLKAGANADARTIHGQTALDIGLSRAHRDLIPLFNSAQRQRSKAEKEAAAAINQGATGFLFRSLRDTGRRALSAAKSKLRADPLPQCKTQQCRTAANRALRDVAERVGRQAAKEGRSAHSTCSTSSSHSSTLSTSSTVEGDAKSVHESPVLTREEQLDIDLAKTMTSALRIQHMLNNN